MEEILRTTDHARDTKTMSAKDIVTGDFVTPIL